MKIPRKSVGLFVLFLSGILGFSIQKSGKKGMILFPSGQYPIGTNNPFNPLEGPAHTVTLKSWYLDANLVTVKDFREFILKTGYKTQSETFGNSGVFQVETGDWTMVDSACWHHPFGPKEAAAKDDHPVTQVSWNDAKAYCAWRKKRLPTEAEWEAAARFKSQGKYSWGSKYDFRANVWTGSFPDTNTREDGFLYTSPAGHFGKNAAGLSDMGGNVWQWCEDPYAPYPGYSGHFESEPNERIMRGGSFLCDSMVCHGYRVSARGHSTEETGLVHVGFRCACDGELKH
jgi:sulfatase modifying factor 1